MNTKLIIAAAALAISLGSASTSANSSPLEFCGTNGIKCPPPPISSLGRFKQPSGTVIKDAVITDSVSNVILPPLVVGSPAPSPTPTSTPPAPTPQPSGSGVGGGYDNNYYDGISCGEGRSIVRHSGFRKVRAMDCRSDVFAYSAKKHNQFFKVFVNAGGYIVHVSKLFY